MAKKREDPQVLFWRNVNKTDGCWEWAGNVRRQGYGRFSVTLPRPEGFKGKTPQKSYVASRYSWEITNGPIPDGMFVCHTCDNPKCVRPDHLFLGTCQDNRTDCVSKGRMARGESHGCAKLTEVQVKEIRALGGTMTRTSIAKLYGVKINTISRVLSGESWGYLGAS